MSNKVPSTLGATITINIKLLASFLFGWASWGMWTVSPDWWSFGLLSMCLAFAALVTVIDAVKWMFRVQTREKAVREFLALGSEPKSSELVSARKLRDVGMR